MAYLGRGSRGITFVAITFFAVSLLFVLDRDVILKK